jgi:hypothetical protein
MPDETRPKIKGLARAQRDAFIAKREIRSLTRGAEEALFRHKSVLSEGSLRETKVAGERLYFGSTMITFDLAQLASVWRGPFDEPEKDRLLRVLEGSVRFKVRTMRLACEEVARRVPDRTLGTAQVETRMHRSGDRLHVDVDVEVPIGLSSRRSQR